MPKDLRSFIAANEDLILRVPKPVSRDHLSDLIVQADRPVVFENIDGYPGWRGADLLFRDRRRHRPARNSRLPAWRARPGPRHYRHEYLPRAR